MPEEVRLWRIEGGDNLREIPRCPLDLEARLEVWLERVLPSRREPWIYYESAGPDYEGFQGFFANIAEIDRFLDLEGSSR